MDDKLPDILKKHSDKEFKIIGKIRVNSVYTIVYSSLDAINIKEVQNWSTSTSFTKGVSYVSFNINGKKLVFVGTHLSSGEGKTSINKRSEELIKIMNFDMKGIISTLQTPSFLRNYFDFIILMGDLNMRSQSLIDGLLTNTTQVKGSYIAEILKLDEFDSLKKVSIHPRLFEHEITFLPTYKLALGSNSYKNDNGHNPSYTDRVVFVRNDNIRSLEYNSIPNFFISDHRPVFCTFKIQTGDTSFTDIEIADIPAEGKINKLSSILHRKIRSK